MHFIFGKRKQSNQCRKLYLDTTLRKNLNKFTLIINQINWVKFEFMNVIA